MDNVKSDKEIHTEWRRYYRFLENLRRSGACNMFGATPYLKEAYKLSYDKAGEILCNWIDNYDELSKMYGWRD